MSRTTKSPIRLAQAALAAGREALALYSHPKSPHKFTQPQLFAMLVLKAFFQLDYRGLVVWLDDWPALCNALELTRVPNDSTLCYAERRLLRKGALTDSLMQPFISPDEPA